MEEGNLQENNCPSGGQRRTAVYSNIACSIPGCTNPVIGQCPGYKGGCGRFYCATHSTDGLCADCARRKSDDDTYEDYCRTAERLERELRLEAALATGLATGLAALAVGALAYVVSLSELSEQSRALVVAGVGAAICLGALIWACIWERKREKEKVAEIGKAKPAFAEFYKAWRKEKNKERLMAGLAIAGVIVAAAIAEAVDSERRVSDIGRSKASFEVVVHLGQRCPTRASPGTARPASLAPCCW
jgi:hypothetical protein